MLGKHLVKTKKYKVHDGDSIESLAKSAGITWEELARFNWGTDVPDEINIFLRDKVGCRTKSEDGNNYIFSSKDDPGIIYIPEEMPEKTFGASQTHTIKVVPVENYNYKPAICHVNFRPDPAWQGEYGFDWMREGDFPIVNAPTIGDLKYGDTGANNSMLGFLYLTIKPGCIGQIFGATPKEIIQPDSNSPKGKFKFDQKKLDELKKEVYKTENITYDDGSKKELYTSYMNIYLKESEAKKNTLGLDESFENPPKSVNILADIHVKESPDEIRFDFIEKDAKNFITVTPQKSDKPSGNPLPLKLTIECKKILEKDYELHAISVYRNTKGITQEQIVGKLIIQANNKPNRREKKILLVNVTTPELNEDEGKNTGSINDKKLFTIKTLNQALINPLFGIENLDVSNDDTFIKKFTIKDPDTKVVSLGSDSPALDQYLYDQLRADLPNRLDDDGNPKDKDRYDKFIKVFCFGEEGDLNGYSYADKIVIYSQAVVSTPAHEILHGLKLPHSFDCRVKKSTVSQNAKFTYRSRHTENVLDYTHQRNDSDFSNARVSTWKWQWDIAKQNADAEEENV